MFLNINLQPAAFTCNWRVFCPVRLVLVLPGLLNRGGQCIWEAGCWQKIGEGGGRRRQIHLGCGRLTFYRDVGSCDKMITRRRDVGENQVWDVGDEGKNMWDVGFSYNGTCGRRHSTLRQKRSQNLKV